jgi:hypothetical protein
MKKAIMSLLFVGLFAAGMQAGSITQEPPHKNKVTHNKVTQNKATKKTAKGAEHGAYDVTHNKATKKTDINEGNKKYSKQNDINNN